jgi:hypothetical protein
MGLTCRRQKILWFHCAHSFFTAHACPGSDIKRHPHWVLVLMTIDVDGPLSNQTINQRWNALFGAQTPILRSCLWCYVHCNLYLLIKNPILWHENIAIKRIWVLTHFFRTFLYGTPDTQIVRYFGACALHIKISQIQSWWKSDCWFDLFISFIPLLTATCAWKKWGVLGALPTA